MDRRNSVPPSWRRPPDTPTVWWVDLMLLGLMVAILALVANAIWGCSSTTAERSACSVVGIALNTAGDRIVDLMATDLAAAEDDAERDAVEAEWAPVLAGYESAAVAQNAWADALENGVQYDVASVGVVYCDARVALRSVVVMPDWPVGGCP